MTVSTHRAGGSAAPTTVPALLRELGLDHSSVEKQKWALRAWLTTHAPPHPLRVSLCENGYGLLLREDSVAKNVAENVAKN